MASAPSVFAGAAPSQAFRNASYSTVTVWPDGSDWQVRIQPSSTSSG